MAPGALGRRGAGCAGAACAALLAAALAATAAGQKEGDLQKSLELYAPKSCKYSLLPTTLNTRAYTAYTGEIYVHDVFGLPSTVKRHIVRLDASMAGLLTLTAEVHRDTPTTLTVDAYRRGEVGKPSGRVFTGKNLLGSGGDDTKAFLHGQITNENRELDIVFELISIDVGTSQVDTRVAEARCWPVRLDLTAVPHIRAPLHWPTECPAGKNILPAPLGGNKADSSQVVPLVDVLKSEKRQPFALGGVEVSDGDKYSFNFGNERPWTDYNMALWNGIVEVPPRLHRFVRFFMRASFRFASSPLQLVIELFELKDTPDGAALYPKCDMGCLGGVPVFNGQIVDHAMPTGFRYRLWILAASMPEWFVVVPQRTRHCLEFNFDYKIHFEERMTPFEVGPQAWLCEFSRLPERIVQLPHPTATEKLNSVNQLVAGRTIWIRDRFGFPPDEAADMEHRITIEVSEPCVFRATTHHSEGVDVFVALRDKDKTRVCRTSRHPGPVPRQTIFCILQPGTYSLVFFADYPLGGLHPCSDFFAQVALRPLAMSNEQQTKECIDSKSDLSQLKVTKSVALATTSRWKPIKVPVTFSERPSTIVVWSHEISISEEDAAYKLYLRLVVNSDYVSSDFRFQVRYEGRYVSDNQVTSAGYADMIGPLDPGAYKVEMYYITGTGGSKDQKFCSSSMVDLRVVSRAQYENGNRTGQWLCSSTRVPPPDSLAPLSDEQILIDSEYMIPQFGSHSIEIKVNEPSLLRAQATSTDAEFRLELRSDRVYNSEGSGTFDGLLNPGTHVLRFIPNVKALGSSKACSTFLLNLLLQPKNSVPVCPWTPGSTDESAATEAQRKADDHLGSVTLDLVPKKIAKDIQVKPPVSFWMAPDMYMKFDLETESTSAIRIDVAVQPPFLPLEVTIQKKRAAGKIEAPVASAEWTESRLLLMQSDLPKGTYVVEFRNPRKFTIVGSEGSRDEINKLCAHVTVSAEVGVSSKEAVNSMRSELLDLPDLLAVQPFPPSFNAVGWFVSAMVPVVGTQVYNFGADSSSESRKSSLVVTEKAVLRLVCEPADLSNADITAVLRQNGNDVATSDNLGQLIAEVQPGSYTIEMQPKANSPFLVTLGLAAEARLKEDISLQDSGRPCMDTFPAIAAGVNFAASGWSIGPRLVRLKQRFTTMEGQLSKVPIVLSTSSILYIEVGSSLPLDLIRIALQVPEGLWVGEQRGLRNSLSIELPPGKYNIHLAQPKPSDILAKSGENTKRCLEFSVYVRATPVNPDARTDAKDAAKAADATGEALSEVAEGRKEELEAREEAAVEAAPCFSMGTVPLPLDISDPQGGSKVMGGPLDKDGRLLIRTRVMLTDMHDGRKKMYLATGGKNLQLKVGVIMAGYTRFSMASQLAFSVQATGSASPIEPLESWSMPEGWERIYSLQGMDGAWLSFHHAHRERSESACLHFGLELEIHPTEDASRMIECSGDSVSPEDFIPDRLNLDQSSSDTKTFRYNKPVANLKEVQSGFLRKIPFTVSTPSWVSAEIGYNFFSSHAEMDIVRSQAATGNTALVTAELDFLHSPSSTTNTRLHVGQVLQPGDYMLRVADDHYGNQISSTGCFPFSFEFRAVPQGAPPAVVSVQPHPSVPVMKGVDLVITLRFSEAPAGNLEDVVQAISLGGVQAAVGGSLNAMQGKYASKKVTTVQASVAEGHLLWVIGWSSTVLADMSSAKLKIGPLRSNTSQKLFHFNPPTYTIVEALPGTPWSGGATTPKDSGSSQTGPAQQSGGVGEVGGIRPEGGSRSSSADSGSSSDGEPRPEGSSSSSGSSESSSGSGEGEIRAESRSSSFSESSPPATPAPAPSASGSKSISEVSPPRDSGDDEDNDGAPKVEEWNPMDSSDEDPAEGSTRRRRSKSKGSGRRRSSSGEDECPEGQVKNAAGICTSSSSWPVGYNLVYSVCGIIVAVFAAAYYYPSLRKMGAGGQATPGARFKDIGARTSEEELGLVQAADRFDEDDDML